MNEPTNEPREVLTADDPAPAACETGAVRERPTEGRWRTTGAAESDQVLTTIEAAQLLRVSTRHITNQATSGAIPARRIGKRWRFSRNKLMEYVCGEDMDTVSRH